MGGGVGGLDGRELAALMVPVGEGRGLMRWAMMSVIKLMIRDKNVSLFRLHLRLGSLLLLPLPTGQGSVQDLDACARESKRAHAGQLQQ